MPEWFARIRQEAAAIASAPIAFTVIVLAAGAVMWTVIQFSYGSLLASKNTQITFLERRLAEWRDKLSGMTADEARARLQALETQVKTLQLQLQPRVLTPEQRQSLIDRARLRPGVQYSLAIVRQADCNDCEAFAAQIASALQESSGWTVTASVTAAPTEKPRYGIGIRVPDPLRPPSEAVRLQTAFYAAGLSFDMVSGGGGPVELLITERPVQ